MFFLKKSLFKFNFLIYSTKNKLSLDLKDRYLKLYSFHSFISIYFEYGGSFWLYLDSKLDATFDMDIEDITEYQDQNEEIDCGSTGNSVNKLKLMSTSVKPDLFLNNLVNLKTKFDYFDLFFFDHFFKIYILYISSTSFHCRVYYYNFITKYLHFKYKKLYKYFFFISYFNKLKFIKKMYIKKKQNKTLFNKSKFIKNRFLFIKLLPLYNSFIKFIFFLHQVIKNLNLDESKLQKALIFFYLCFKLYLFNSVPGIVLSFTDLRYTTRDQFYLLNTFIRSFNIPVIDCVLFNSQFNYGFLNFFYFKHEDSLFWSLFLIYIVYKLEKLV